MSQTRNLVHIVADFATPGGETAHAWSLQALLAGAADVHCWSEGPMAATPAAAVRTIRPYHADYPVGGTLIVVGPQRQLHPWAARCRAERIILVCTAFEPAQLFRQLAYLRQAHLPEPEISYASEQLRKAVGLPGEVNVCPVAVEELLATERPRRRPVVGRHSRDIAGEHHPADVSLYRQLALRGFDVRILGGTCLAPLIAQPTEGLELLPVGHTPVAKFLASIDIFHYRTAPNFCGTSGRSVLEALASGLPVVTSADGESASWIAHGENGYLVSGQDDAFDYLTRLGENAELRRRLGAQARKTALALSGGAARRRMADWYLCRRGHPVSA